MIRYKKRIRFFIIVLLFVLVAFTPLIVSCEGAPESPGAEGTIDAEDEVVDTENVPADNSEDIDTKEQATDMEDNADQEVPYSRGKVLKVITEEDRDIPVEGGSFSAPTQVVEVLVIKGSHQGEKLRAEYALNYGFDTDYKLSQLSKGDEVLLLIEENEDGTVANAYVAEIARDKYILYLVIAFVIALVAIGKGRGLKAVLSLVLTAVAVLKVLLPAILKGWDPVIVSVGVCAAVIGATILIISGPNKKTLSAVIGTTGGVIVAGIVALIFGSLAKLTGIGGDESQMLMYIPQGTYFDFRGLLFAGILIGTMGANMDVGMSIASAMHEIKASNSQITDRDLIKAGMNVGRDIMATMSNTLILAYAGGSLQLMLLLMAYDTPFYKVINWDVIASEVLRAIAGSIGLIFTIPITALVAGTIEKRRKSSGGDPGVDYR